MATACKGSAKKTFVCKLIYLHVTFCTTPPLSSVSVTGSPVPACVWHWASAAAVPGAGSGPAAGSQDTWPLHPKMSVSLCLPPAPCHSLPDPLLREAGRLTSGFTSTQHTPLVVPAAPGSIGTQRCSRFASWPKPQQSGTWKKPKLEQLQRQQLRSRSCHVAWRACQKWETPNGQRHWDATQKPSNIASTCCSAANTAQTLTLAQLPKK